jgi:hypothetical protein
MHANAALLLSFVASASASAAVNYMAILPRATPSSAADASQCASDALSIVSSMPTPPPALVSDLTEHPQTDPCHFSLPQSISAEYSSYSVEVLSWLSGHKDELTSLAAECSVLSSYTSLVNVCTSGHAAGGSSDVKTTAAQTTAAGATQTGSGSGNFSKTATGPPKTTSSNAAGALETGISFAVLAAAGLAALL